VIPNLDGQQAPADQRGPNLEARLVQRDGLFRDLGVGQPYLLLEALAHHAQGDLFAFRALSLLLSGRVLGRFRHAPPS